MYSGSDDAAVPAQRVQPIHGRGPMPGQLRLSDSCDLHLQVRERLSVNTVERCLLALQYHWRSEHDMSQWPVQLCSHAAGNHITTSLQYDDVHGRLLRRRRLPLPTRLLYIQKHFFILSVLLYDFRPGNGSPIATDVVLPVVVVVLVVSVKAFLFQRRHFCVCTTISYSLRHKVMKCAFPGPTAMRCCSCYNKYT